MTTPDAAAATPATLRQLAEAATPGADDQAWFLYRAATLPQTVLSLLDTLAARDAEVTRLLTILDGFKPPVATLRACIENLRRYTGHLDEAVVLAAAVVLADVLEARAAIAPAPEATDG